LALSLASTAQYGESVLLLASQSVTPAPQVAAHLLATQAVPMEHDLPHAPQLASSLRVSAQYVSSSGVGAGHSTRSGAQVVAHEPSAQT
jgi:hypothetical protein